MSSPGWMDAASVAEALRMNGGDGVKIAILDSGIEIGHPGMEGVALQDDIAVRESFGKIIVESGEGKDLYGHGTAVASVVRHHAPKAVLGSFRVLNARNSSRHYVILEGIRLAIERGYQVLNCSFGGQDHSGAYGSRYKDVIDRAYLRRVHIVTACSNRDVNIQECPGSFNSCVNVNMARETENAFSYRSDHLVEFAAAGVGIRVPWLNGTFRIETGSSFAAPVVSAHLARILSVFPDLSVSQAKSLLQAYGSPWQEDAGLGGAAVSGRESPGEAGNGSRTGT